MKRQSGRFEKRTAVDDRVHVDNGGVERRWWHWHVGLGQTTRAHGGRGGREREGWWVVPVEGRRKLTLVKIKM